VSRKYIDRVAIVDAWQAGALMDNEKLLFDKLCEMVCPDDPEYPVKHPENCLRGYNLERDYIAPAKNGEFDAQGYLTSNIVGEDAELYHEANIGHSVIDRFTKIGYSRIRNSVIGRAVIVGDDCDITDSIIKKEVVLPGKNDITFSIVRCHLRLPYDFRPMAGSEVTREPFVLTHAPSFYLSREVSESGVLRIGCQVHHILAWDRYVIPMALKYNVEPDCVVFYDTVVKLYRKYWLTKLKELLARAKRYDRDLCDHTKRQPFYRIVDRLIDNNERIYVPRPVCRNIDEVFNSIKLAIECHPILVKCADKFDYTPDTLPSTDPTEWKPSDKEPMPANHRSFNSWDYEMFQGLEERL
jgi:hypothetical protein